MVIVTTSPAASVKSPVMPAAAVRFSSVSVPVSGLSVRLLEENGRLLVMETDWNVAPAGTASSSWLTTPAAVPLLLSSFRVYSTEVGVFSVKPSGLTLLEKCISAAASFPVKVVDLLPSSVIAVFTTDSASELIFTGMATTTVASLAIAAFVAETVLPLTIMRAVSSDCETPLTVTVTPLVVSMVTPAGMVSLNVNVPALVPSFFMVIW